LCYTGGLPYLFKDAKKREDYEVTLKGKAAAQNLLKGSKKNKAEGGAREKRSKG